MGLCDDFVEVHRRLAQLESLLPWEELPAPPAKRQCVTQVAVPEPLARPPPEPAEGCDSQSPSAVPSAQGGRCSKGHLLKRAVLGSGKGLVCDGPCGRSLRSNMARWSCATCDFDLCAAPPPPPPPHGRPSRCAPPQSSSHASSWQVLKVRRHRVAPLDTPRLQGKPGAGRDRQPWRRRPLCCYTHASVSAAAPTLVAADTGPRVRRIATTAAAAAAAASVAATAAAELPEKPSPHLDEELEERSREEESREEDKLCSPPCCFRTFSSRWRRNSRTAAGLKPVAR